MSLKWRTRCFRFLREPESLVWNRNSHDSCSSFCLFGLCCWSSVRLQLVSIAGENTNLCWVRRHTWSSCDPLASLGVSKSVSAGSKVQGGYRRPSVPAAHPSPAPLLPAVQQNRGFCQSSQKLQIPNSTGGFLKVDKNDPAVVEQWWGPCALTSIRTLFFQLPRSAAPCPACSGRGAGKGSNPQTLPQNCSRTQQKTKERGWQRSAGRGERRCVDPELILLLILGCEPAQLPVWLRKGSHRVGGGRARAGDTAGIVTCQAVLGRGTERVPVRTPRPAPSPSCHTWFGSWTKLFHVQTHPSPAKAAAVPLCLLLPLLSLFFHPFPLNHKHPCCWHYRKINKQPINFTWVPETREKLIWCCLLIKM